MKNQEEKDGSTTTKKKKLPSHVFPIKIISCGNKNQCKRCLSPLEEAAEAVRTAAGKKEIKKNYLENFRPVFSCCFCCCFLVFPDFVFNMKNEDLLGIFFLCFVFCVL